jgi:hypothetical protein
MTLLHSPSIVRDGLILSLDPANKKSLPLQNLFLHSEDFSNSYWTKILSSINSNSVYAPDGTITADKLIGSSGATTRQAIEVYSISVDTNSEYVFSVYLKAAERRYASIWFNSSSVSPSAFYGAGNIIDLQTGAFAVFAQPGMTIEDAGNGWYRVSLLATPTVTTMSFSIALNSPNNNQAPGIFTGDGVSGIYVWGAQLRRTYSPPTYIKTESSVINFGNTIIDISNNGNNGTLVNSPTFSSLNQGSINVDGVDDYIVCGPVPHTGTPTSSVSWEIWVCPQSTGGNIMSMSSVNPQGSWNMPPITASSQRFTGKIWSNTRLQDTSTYNLNQWYQVVLIWDYPNTTQKLYVNGIQKAFQSGITYSASGLNNFLFFGQQNPGADNAGMFQGKYGQINVYGNKALTDTEVKQNFNALRGRYGI